MATRLAGHRRATSRALTTPRAAAATPAPVPVREIGSTQATSSWWLPGEEDSQPELRWPLSIEVYDRMRRTDSQVKSVLRAVTLPLLSTTWWLDPTGCRPEVVDFVARDLGLPVRGRGEVTVPGRRRDRFSWHEHLRLSLLRLAYGHMVFEQVARIEDDGRAHLRKLGPRMPRTIAAFNVASDGGLVSVEQFSAARNRGPAGRITLPVSRLVVYTNEREGGNWVGESLLRSAWKNWVIKDRLLRVQAQSVDRNGMGVPVYEAAEGETDLSAGRALAQAIRSGDNAGAAIPAGSKLVLLGVEGTLPDADKPIRYHDEQIARAVLAHFLNLGQQTGSWALGTTFADFFTGSLQAVGQDQADTASLHIVEDLVDWNWGPDEPAPRVVFDRIGSRRDATAEAIKVLRDAGVLRSDEDLEDFVRELYNLPARQAGTPDAAAAPAVD